jgi:hypothetical protein
VSRKTQENIVALVVLALLFGVIYLSFDYGPRARMVPLPVAIFGVVLVLLQLAWQNLRPTVELQVDLLKAITQRDHDTLVQQASEGAASAGQRELSSAQSRKRERNAYLIVAAFLALILLFGPIPAAALFTFAYFVLSGHYGWLKAAVHTTLFIGGTYLLFVVALDVQLYHGVLEPLIHR